MTPRATYRLQLNASFGFDSAAKAASYLARLGVSHAYLSPYLKARVGSAHGYDIVDHGELNRELGDDAAFARMADAFKAQAIGHILDYVPNHMGVGGADNPLWLDVLEWGPDARHAGWFDIEWEPDGRYLHGKVLVPLLGDHYGVELERGMLQLKFDAALGSFAVWAYDAHMLPVWPPHYARILGDATPELEQLADAFNWLTNWRQQMPQRAAELKLRLAALVREDPQRDALNRALARFNGRPGDSGSWREMDGLIQEQRWRVAHFRVAADDINYRRFFNINELAGLRVELPEVFDHMHQRVLRLVKSGVIDGLRIDHIDGLFDPKGYLRRLRRRLAIRGAGADFYLVVEKILSAHEGLREDWPIDGTTGYDFLNQVLNLLIDSGAAQAFTDCYREFTGEQRSLAEIVHLSKLQIMENEMASELNMVARDMARLARQNPRTADFTRNLLRRAIKELIACFPVYRTYIDDSGEMEAADLRDLAWALAQARRNGGDIDPSAFDFLELVASGALAQSPRSGYSRTSLLRCAMRMQQYSGPVIAKGLEDTAFYRYNRFIALNEVGGDPDHFGGTIAAFHRANLGRAQRWPRSMLCTATHDTKRGEDARARLAALSEFADEWRQHLPMWSRIIRGPANPAETNRLPDRNDEYLLYQVLVGSWPCELLALDTPEDAQLAAFADRVRRTMVKSIREARVHTGWAFPNADYEKGMTDLIDTALTGSRAGSFLAAFLPFARRVAAAGAHNSLIQTVVKLTVPGIPDLYIGTELWDLSMVDPDNRRPVDHERHARMLEEIEAGLRGDRGAHMRSLWHHWPDGRIKLAAMATLLGHRRSHAPLYAEGDYQPLQVQGAADALCAYARARNGRCMIVAVALGARRAERGVDAGSRVLIPEAMRQGPWREILSGRTLAPDPEHLAAAELFSDLPVAVLEPA